MGLQPEWMLKSSPLKGAALARLLDGPIHGYKLARTMNELLDLDIEPNQLYRKLEALERDGLAYSHVVPAKRAGSRRAQGKPRRDYFPTEDAPGAVMEWMSATSPFAVARSEFYIKLAVARKEHVPALLEMVDLLESKVKEEIDRIPQEASFQTLAELGAQLARSTKLGYLRAELGGAVKARSGLGEFL